jgi:hypothetical protein
MRKVGVEGQTRRDIMGNESGSMADRYTMIDDEAVEDARRKMEVSQRQRGLVADDRAARIAELRQKLIHLEGTGPSSSLVSEERLANSYKE